MMGRVQYLKERFLGRIDGESREGARYSIYELAMIVVLHQAYNYSWRELSGDLRRSVDALKEKMKAIKSLDRGRVAASSSIILKELNETEVSEAVDLFKVLGFSSQTAIEKAHKKFTLSTEDERRATELLSLLEEYASTHTDAPAHLSSRHKNKGIPRAGVPFGAIESLYVHLLHEKYLIGAITLSNVTERTQGSVKHRLSSIRRHGIPSLEEGSHLPEFTAEEREFGKVQDFISQMSEPPAVKTPVVEVPAPSEAGQMLVITFKVQDSRMREAMSHLNTFKDVLGEELLEAAMGRLMPKDVEVRVPIPKDVMPEGWIEISDVSVT